MNNKEIYIYIADVTPLDDEEKYYSLYNAATEDRRKRTDGLRFLKDKKLSLGAEYLLKYALEEQNISPGDGDIIRNENGKPFLRNGGVFFNLSHSGEKVMCVIGALACGCDAEKAEGEPKKLAKRFFSEDENYALGKCADNGEYTDLFFRLWTLKESFLKCTGDGLGRPLSSFSVITNGSRIFVKEHANDYLLGEINLNDGYKYSWCAEYPDGVLSAPATVFEKEDSDSCLKILKYKVSL